MKRTVFGAVVALLLSPAALLSQEPADTFPLERFIVTATRVPLPADAVPAAVTIIEGSELRARGVRFLADALRAAPGTPVAQTGSHGGITSLYMRGGESDYVQVLIDGVPANQPGGAFDFAHLRVEDVERIEIVRGPVSVLYGSDAVTGVIHVITRRGRGAPSFTGSIAGGHADRVGAGADGASGSFAVDAGVAGSASGVAYAASLAHFATDGAYAFNNEYDNTMASARLAAGGDRTGVELNGRLTDNTYHFPTDGAGRLVDRNQYSTGRTITLGGSATHAFSDAVRATVDAALSDNESTSEDAPDSPADTLGFYAGSSTGSAQRRSVDARVDLTSLPVATVLTFGAGAEAQDGETAALTLSQFGPFPDSAEYQRSTRSVYAQVLTTPSSRVTLSAGARVDDGSSFDAFTTWRAGASVRPGRWILRAAAGSAFKEPTFYENFAQGFVIGNPALAPERTLSAELGVERTLGRGAHLAATAYTQRFRDLIQYTSAPTRPGASNYFNLGSARARGLETSARLDFAAQWRLEVSYDWLQTEVLESGDEGDLTFVEGSRLLRRPEHRVSGALTWVGARAHAALVATRVGQREDLDFSDPSAFNGRRVTLDAYTLVNASAEVQLTRAVAATARVENALDSRHAEIVGFPARGRAIHLGIRAAFRK